MILDWYENTGQFVARVPRKEPGIYRMLEVEHGFNFWRNSPAHEAVFSTEEPYAAISFFGQATERAQNKLRSLHERIEKSRALDCPARYRTPEGCELWPFQRANLAYALERKHCLVGDQPGLGKTPVAITFANEIRAKKVLVICPAAIRLQWAAKIREWSTTPWPYTVHTILHGRRGVHPHAQWTVCSYDLASTDAIGSALAAHRYDLLIVDEAHYLKTIDARRTRAVFGGGEKRVFDALASRADRILALTGTPLPNRPREAYTLARHLCHDAIDWMSAADFSERFNPSEMRESKSGKRFVIEATFRCPELQNRMRANFMTRHEKRHVLTQLKIPKYDLVYVEENGAIRAALAAERMLDIDPGNLTGADMTMLGQIATVRRMMGIAMAPRVADYIDAVISSGEEKLCVFGWHTEVLNILEKRCRKHGVVRIDGSTGALQRHDRILQFVKSKQVRIILGQTLSLGTGVDGLQDVCDHGILAEPDWVPGVNQQAVDRLDRGGQRNQVRADFCVAAGSFSERILASALRKLSVIDRTLDRKFVA